MFFKHKYLSILDMQFPKSNFLNKNKNFYHLTSPLTNLPTWSHPEPLTVIGPWVTAGTQVS